MQYVQNRIKESVNAQKNGKQEILFQNGKFTELGRLASFVCHFFALHEFSNKIANKIATNLK
jgi:hypothetical protein